MKRLSIFFVLALGLWARASWSQAATPRLWRTGSPGFATEAQLRSFAKRYENNSRVTYYLILRAFNQGKAMSRMAALTYYDLYQANPNNVRVQAAFAFANYMATEYDLEGAPLPNSELHLQSWQALNLRPHTTEALPKDPTILLMAARPTYFLNEVGIMENLPDMKRGLNWARQAVRYDPDWAEAHYWLATILQYYAMNNPVTATKQTDRNIMRQSIEPAQTALRLGAEAGDRVTQIGCWFLLTSAYTSLHENQQALQYLDRYTAAVPPIIRQRQSLSSWRRDLVRRIAKGDT